MQIIKKLDMKDYAEYQEFIKKLDEIRAGIPAGMTTIEYFYLKKNQRSMDEYD